MRLSLKELFLVVAFIAFGCAALKYASPGVLAAVQGVTGIMFLGMLVAAVVDRGRRQAFAIGFALGAAVYALVIWGGSLAGQGFWNGGFGTDQASAALYRSMVTYRWTNEATGEVDRSFRTSAPEGTLQVVRWEKVPPSADTPASAAVESDSSTDDDVTDDAAARPLTEQEMAAKVAELRQVLQGSDVNRILSSRDQQLLQQYELELAFAPARSGGRRATTARGGRGGSGARVSRARRGYFVEDFTQISDEQLANLVRANPRSVDEVIRRIEVLRQAGISISNTGQSAAQALGYQQVSYRREEAPDPTMFQLVATCLWVLLLGYVGGQFGRYVYGRRTREAG